MFIYFCISYIFSANKSSQLVSWSSWSWHLLNTQNVPSSILGEINFFPTYTFFFACDLGPKLSLLGQLDVSIDERSVNKIR